MTTRRYEYIRTDTGEFICPHCNVVKKIQSTMNMHYKARHDGTFKHKCKHCPYETSTKQTLDKHTLAKHPNHVKDKPKPFDCPFESCEFHSITKAGLRSHYLLKHLSKEVVKYLGKTESGDVQCSGCGEQFASKPAYVYHLVGCLPEDILAHENVKKGLGIV